MNSSYFTEDQLFREFKDFFTKRSCTAHRKMGKTGTIERLYGKSLEKWAFWYRLSRVYGGLNLDLFYTVIFSRRTKKLNHLVLQLL
jgi:hypothetical protein